MTLICAADPEQKGASADELKALLGKGRAKKGIFEGDLYEGERGEDARHGEAQHSHGGVRSEEHTSELQSH